MARFRPIRLLFGPPLVWAWIPGASAWAASPAPTEWWLTRTPTGEPWIHLYVFLDADLPALPAGPALRRGVAGQLPLEGLSNALIALSVSVAALALTGLAVMVEALRQSRMSR